MRSEIWRLEGVLDLLEKIDGTMPDRSFAFVLGAGASVSSGIPSGKMLAQDWLRTIHKRECIDNMGIDAWLQLDPFKVDGKLSLSSAAEFYPKIFERCFRGDHDAGYAALETAMDGKTPGMGYSLLAEIIESTRHKVVITTNFDNLVADALALHAHKSPLVVGHEALAGFVRPYSRRPLIAKIHRDLLFSPINDQAGVDELGEPWKNALRKLFQHYTPIVIGYGGNDGSLMGLLSSLKKGGIAGQMIWCYRDEPPPQAIEVLNQHDGIRVKISGFDEFMLSLASRLIKDFDAFTIADRIKQMGDDRSEKYRKRTTELHASLAQGSVEQKQAGALLANSVRDELNWWSWQMKANAEPDLEKRNAVYKEGLERFPASAGLHGNYAVFLSKRRQDFDAAEAMYKKALELDPTGARRTGNYAVFLSKRRKDFDAAEAMYKKALELDPADAHNTGNYANFLNDQRKDFDTAEAMYKKALALGPTDARNTGNYANFLSDTRKDFDAAEAMYKKALALDPTDARNTGNYANFLSDQRKDFDAAEAMYKKALELDPTNARHTGNYATLLSEQHKDFDAAEAMYKKALELDPTDAINTGNYAIFLSGQRKDFDAAETMYKKALALDPDNSNICANLAAQLLTRARGGDDLTAIYTLSKQALANTGNEHTQAQAEALLYLCLHAEMTSASAADPMRRLKALLRQGYDRAMWSFATLFDTVLPRIPAEREPLYRAIGAAILDATQIAALDAFPEWMAL